MKIFHTSALSTGQLEAILRLWNAEYPAQLAYSHISELDTYLAALTVPTHYFAVAADTSIVGWAFVFTRDSERWFAIIVDSRAQGSGIGTLLLTRLKQDEPILNGWATDQDSYLRADAKPYRSPLGFYRKNGFSLVNGRKLNTANLSAVAIKWER